MNAFGRRIEACLGGIAHLAGARPWLFDGFSRRWVNAAIPVSCTGAGRLAMHRQNGCLSFLSTAFLRKLVWRPRTPGGLVKHHFEFVLILPCC